MNEPEGINVDLGRFISTLAKDFICYNAFIRWKTALIFDFWLLLSEVIHQAGENDDEQSFRRFLFVVSYCVQPMGIRDKN